VAVRKRLFHPEEVRQKIRTSQLVNRLNAFVNGEIELTHSQVTAALGLIRKTMPDLSAMAHSGIIETTKPEELSDDRLAHIAAGSRSGAIEAASGEEEPGELH
jgi:hypothetical protein